MNSTLQIAQLKVSPSRRFDKTSDGRLAHLYKLKNRNGLEVTITNYDARLLSLLITNRNGNLIDVIAGSDKVLQLNAVKGMAQGVIWDARQINDHTVELHYPKKSMAGNLKAKVTYLLKDDNGLKITFEINSDTKIVINPADLIAFNLNGRNNGNILNHQVWIKADNYLPVDANMVVTAKTEPVVNTPFDFRNSATIGSRISDHHVQLTNGNGYNHNFVLNKHASRTPVARVMGDKSGIIMEIFTDQPGLQFYSGNVIQTQLGGVGEKDDAHAAFAMRIGAFFDLLPRVQDPPPLQKAAHTHRYVTCYQLKK